jgi:hypothetical protein
MYNLYFKFKFYEWIENMTPYVKKINYFFHSYLHRLGRFNTKLIIEIKFYTKNNHTKFIMYFLA